MPRRPAGTGRAKKSQRTSAVTISKLNGSKFQPTPNPPSIAFQPWLPVTLTFTGKPSSTTLKVVVDHLKQQLDPTGRGFNSNTFESDSDNSFRVQLKFSKIIVYNLTGRTISLSVFDDIVSGNSDKDQLGGWVDCGGSSTFPSIGYDYPISHKSLVHRPDKQNSGSVVYQTTAGSENDTIANYLYLHFRFDGPVKFSSDILTPETLTIQRSIEGNTESIKSLITEVKTLQPSLIDKIVNGVKQSAALVSVAAADRDLIIKDLITELDRVGLSPTSSYEDVGELHNSS